MRKTWINRSASVWHALWARYPEFGWLRTWGVSGASICSGLATLLLFRRGIEYFPVVTGYLLLLWLVGVLLAEHRQRLVRQAPRGVSMASVASVLVLSCGSSTHSRGERRPTAAVGRVPSAGGPPGSTA